jgi:hypothetical protein
MRPAVTTFSGSQAGTTRGEGFVLLAPVFLKNPVRPQRPLAALMHAGPDAGLQIMVALSFRQPRLPRQLGHAVPDPGNAGLNLKLGWGSDGGFGHALHSEDKSTPPHS